MASDATIFLATQDARLMAQVGEAAGLRLIGTTADGDLARSALRSRTARLYVLDARVMGRCDDISALAEPDAGLVLIGPAGPAPAGWEEGGRERRFCPEPYDPLEIVAWAQWFATTMEEPALDGMLLPVPAEPAASNGAVPLAASPGAPAAAPDLSILRPRAGRRATEATGAPVGVVAVASPKGGVGKTTVAVNLAVAAAMRGEDAILLDFDRFAADASLLLGIESGPTLLDVVPRLDGLDRERADRDLARHPSGLRLVRGPARPDLAPYVAPEDLARLVVWARQHYARVFVDTPTSGTDDALRETLERAGAVLVVTTLDAAALRQAAIFIRVLRDAGLPPGGDLRLVVNRASATSPVSLSGLPKFFGISPAAVIPEDARALDAAAFEGQPVAWQGRPAAVVEALRSLELALAGQVPHPARPARAWRWPLRRHR